MPRRVDLAAEVARLAADERDRAARARVGADMDPIAVDWPEDRVEDAEEAVAERQAIERTRGALSGVYPPGYLERLHGEWPE